MHTCTVSFYRLLRVRVGDIEKGIFETEIRYDRPVCWFDQI
jgi:hypothetical protein